MPITEQDLDELLTVDEAARFLRLSRATIYRMISAREVEVVHYGSGGGRARLTRRALLAAVQRKTIPAATEERAG